AARAQSDAELAGRAVRRGARASSTPRGARGPRRARVAPPRAVARRRGAFVGRGARRSFVRRAFGGGGALRSLRRGFVGRGARRSFARRAFGGGGRLRLSVRRVLERRASFAPGARRGTRRCFGRRAFVRLAVDRARPSFAVARLHGRARRVV